MPWTLQRSVAAARASLLAATLSAACGCAGNARGTETSVVAAEPTPAAAEPAPAQAPALPQPTPPPGAAPAEPAAPAALNTVTVKGDFAAPESVLYDIEADLYLVSNVNGSPLMADGNGFISRVSPEGQIIALKWIGGPDSKVRLNAPKGMAISAGVLYVADLDRIRKFDSQSGAPRGEIPVAGSTFVNDVAAGPDGTIYFTDSGLKAGFERSGTDAVYKIHKNQAVALARGKQLNQPNGLMVDAAGVWIVTYGAKELYDVKKGNKARVQALPGGLLDGIIRTSAGQLYVSSWELNQVLTGEPGGGFSKAFDANAPADIGYDVKRNRLLVPLMMENTLQFVQL